MTDMLVLAFQTDSTRIAAFLMGHDGSNRTFEDDGRPRWPSFDPHHQKDPAAGKDRQDQRLLHKTANR